MARAEPSLFATTHTGKAFCGHPSIANRISSTLANTSSNTGPARPCNSDRRIRCTVVCAWVPLNASLPATRAPRFPPAGYSYVTHQTWARRFCGTILPVGSCLWYKGQCNLWWLGKSSAHIPTPGHYVVRVLDDSGLVKLVLSSSRYNTALGAVHGS